MSIVNLTGVQVLNNLVLSTEPYQFEIAFECLGQLQTDLEFRISYVKQADRLTEDLILDSFNVGPVPIGLSKFNIEVPAPDFSKINSLDIVDVTVVYISCYYREQEFVRCGFYQNNYYESEELMNEPPLQIDFTQLKRNLLAERPKVTVFPINWDEPNPELQVPDQPEADLDQSQQYVTLNGDDNEMEADEGDFVDEDDDAMSVEEN
ncbi:anti-silence-domain-containing protein [Conidiobolus coronatus NRRL 28638]|uniref:Anti-silencing function protein 1 n=1 Tax=Conidiobolus coronatus (strain ATCC 28846 / CBS 209.66 / NRRL 28638) TaxID=796925 RepID=A0A137PI49_CONC2|nr:anti-silence-domain-containing protein [Conidiobolus coronatus NRRL 28638]|eukprot:KXN74659.1 anti-silence-domain-containing protein [Conidiobolus coronatus NRRL 28638]